MFLRTLVISLLLLTAACGGGGGDGSPTGDAGGEGGGVPGVAIVDEHLANVAAEALMLQMHVSHFLSSTLPRDFTAGEFEYLIYGSEGLIAIEGEIADGASANELKVRFEKFAFEGVLFTARLTISGDATLTVSNSGPPVLDFDSLGFHNGETASVISGSMTFAETGPSTVVTATSGPDSWRSELDMTVDSLSEERGQWSIDGRMEIGGSGYVDVQTVVPADLPKANMYGFHSPREVRNGVYRIVGANDARAVVRLDDRYAGTVNLDEDGDGGFERARRFRWSNLDSDWTSDGLRPYPIAVARFPFHVFDDERPRAGEMLELDGAMSISESTELLRFSWEIWQRPDGSNAKLERAETANPVFVPDVEGNYVFALTVKSARGTAFDTVHINLDESVAPELITTTSLGSSFRARPGDAIQVAFASGKGSGVQFRRPPGSNALLTTTTGFAGAPFLVTTDVEGIYDIGPLRINVSDDASYFTPSFIGPNCLMWSGDADGDGERDRVLGIYEPKLLLSSDPGNPRELPLLSHELVDLDENGKMESFNARPYEDGALNVYYLDSDNTSRIASTVVPLAPGEGFPDVKVARLPDGTSLLFASTSHNDYEWRWTGTTLESSALIADLVVFRDEFVQPDYDGDGLLDAISAQQVVNDVVVTLWKGKADNTFEQVATRLFPQGGFGVMRVVDLDGDSREELLVAEGPLRHFRELHNASLGSTDLHASADLFSIAVRDIDGDGRLDLSFVTDPWQEEMVLMFQESNGSFGRTRTYPIDNLAFRPPGHSRARLHWVDINGDGEQDMVYQCVVSFAVTGGAE